MAKIVKNTTGSDIEIYETGTSIPASGQITIDPINYNYWATSETIAELTPLINSGDIIINDGNNDLNAANGIYHISFPDYAFNTRFLSDPERANGFNSKTTQEAIEEARISGIGSVVPFVFANSGNTSNKWLEYATSSAPSDNVPLIMPQPADIKGFTFSNNDDGVDMDVEIYRNNSLIYTWEIRNKRTAYQTGITAGSVLQGDRLSVFFKQYTDGTGDTTAQTPILTVLIKFTAEQAGSGGTQNGL